eukprot:g16269.t1
MGFQQFRLHQQLLEKYGIRVALQHLEFSAKTAGGDTRVLGIADVLYSLPEACQRLPGITQAIIVDDRTWKEPATGLTGTLFNEAVGLDVLSSRRTARCGGWRTAPTNGQYHVDIWATLSPSFLQKVQESLKLKMPLARAVRAAGRTIVANRGAGVESRFSKTFPTAVKFISPALQRLRAVVDRHVQHDSGTIHDTISGTPEAATTCIQPVEVANTLDILQTDIDSSQKCRNVDDWYVYARIQVGARNGLPLKGQDSKAKIRTTRNLDEIREKCQSLCDVWHVSKFLIEVPFERNGRDHLNTVTFFLFDEPVPGSAPLVDVTGCGVPVLSRATDEVRANAFQRATQTPTALNVRRIATHDVGRQMPLLLRGRSKEFRVPAALDDLVEDNETGLSLRVQTAVEDRIEYREIAQAVGAFLSRTKNGCAVITGDGRKACVAVGELLGKKLGLRADKQAVHFGLKPVLAGGGSRATSCGGIRKFGFGLVSHAQDYFDERNPTIPLDPRKKLSRRQQIIFNYLGAVSKRQTNRVHRPLLMNLAKEKFRSVKEDELTVAVDAVLRTSLAHFRCQSWPTRKIWGTWHAVDVSAVSQLDTTFVSVRHMLTPGAVVQLIRKVTGDTWGRCVGDKFKGVSFSQMLGSLRLDEEDLVPKAKRGEGRRERLLPDDDDDGAAPERGQPTAAAICKFIAEHIKHCGRILLMDPGKENVSAELVLMLLGAGIRVRIIASNAPTVLADIEGSHVHLKAELEAMARHPILRELPLDVSIELVLNARRERRATDSFLEEGEEWRLRGRGIPVGGDALRYWDPIEAQKCKYAREEHREAAFAVVSNSYLDPEMHAGLRDVYARLASQLERAGVQADAGDMIEWKNKLGTSYSPGHLVAKCPKNVNWTVRALGAASATSKVLRTNCRRVPESEFLTGIPDSIEITYADVEHLPVICQEVREQGYTDRIKREGERAAYGKSKLLPCSDCFEMRYVPENFVGSVVRCCLLKPEVFCGDVSDDQLTAQGLWVPEKQLRSTVVSKRWREDDAHVPAREKLGVRIGGEERKEFAVEEIAEEDPILEDFDDASSEPSVEEEDLEDASSEAAEEEQEADGDSAGAGLDAPDMMSNEANFVDITLSEFDEICAIMEVQAQQAAADEAVRAEEVKKNATAWTATESVLGLPQRRGSSALKNVMSRLKMYRVSGPHVETQEFATLTNLLSEQPVPEGWAAPRWLLDEIFTVWGESNARKLEDKAPKGKDRTAKKFYVLETKNPDEYMLSTTLKGTDTIVGAVRFEFAATFAKAQGVAKERTVSVHTPGMTAAARKRLRSARKLADMLPKHVLEQLDMDEFVKYALLKEMKGNLGVRDGEERANVERAEVKADDNRQILTSRFILDGKYQDELTMVVKVRWAPGGHLQEVPSEDAENASPTLASAELRVMTAMAGRWRRAYVDLFDVPRAFNISEPYAAGQEPLMRFPRGMNPRMQKAFEGALELFNKETGLNYKVGDVLSIRVPQYGLLDAAYAFYAKARKGCIQQNCMPSCLAPTVYRLVIGGKIVALLGSHVDDFIVIGDGETKGVKEFVRRKMLAAFSSLEAGSFESVGPEWKAIAGKSVRLVEKGGHQALDVSMREKIREIALFQSDEERSGGPPQLDRQLSAAEVTRLRGVRGGCGFINEWMYDFLYMQRVLSAGADEVRTVGNALRMNTLVREMKELAGNGQLYVRLWLDFKDPVFLLLTDGSFQARPLKVPKDGKVVLSRGMAELVSPEDVAKMAEARADQLRPMVSYVLLLTSREELERAKAEKDDLRCSMLDWAVTVVESPVTGSYGAEAIGYDRGTQAAEIVKLKYQEFGTLLGDGKLSDELFLAAEALTQYDLLDSTSVIARVLNRAPTLEVDSAVFKAITRARQLQRRSNKPMIHISDLGNVVDCGTKFWPGTNQKREKLRDVMRGYWSWLSGPGDKRGDSIGVLRKLEKRDAEWADLNDGKQLKADTNKSAEQIIDEELSKKVAGDKPQDVKGMFLYSPGDSAHWEVPAEARTETCLPRSSH